MPALRQEPKASTELTPAQFRVLRALYLLMKENPAPSLAEWANVAGIGEQPVTTTSINQHFHALKTKGVVTNTPGKTRSMRITPEGLKELGVKK